MPTSTPTSRLGAPIDYGAFTSFAYVGVFVVTFLANALIAIPIPYIPIVAHIGATAGLPWLVVVLGALGSIRPAR